ncbi:probable pectinesterase 55 [Arachis stenosperma]|uniref:probable pectinesterase 55 n=1 Tax=Arachis stenosperma TaxID=217475 RepID=UPI0025AC8F9B|nr:probable pectinesterase 55 [Arachis stenosperma]
MTMLLFLVRWWSCVFVLLNSGVVNAQYYRTVGDKILPFSKIIVDSSGHGNFSTIQSAIDSVPSNNKNWVSINVKPGIYREKVTIPTDKPYIILKGSEKMRTWVEWDDHNTTAQSPTFQSMADNIVVKSISFRVTNHLYLINYIILCLFLFHLLEKNLNILKKFKFIFLLFCFVQQNTYNNSINKNFRVPALAALISGDKSYFYKVRFFGLQDTLWDNQGKHYYKFCTIQGAVDFIFGAGQSLFERCNINVIGRALGEGFVRYITAQGREHPKDSNGFVFKNCSISGDGSIFLGRPWRPYARVLFYSTNMTNIIQPAGWNLWDSSQNVDNIMFAEYDNFGPGSNTSKRVDWITKLNLETVNMMTSTTFIDSEGWLNVSSSF